MHSAEQKIQPAACRMTPGIDITDPVSAYWVAQVNLRLRREIAWCWFQRSQHKAPANGMQPPIADAAGENLDLVRHHNHRQQFFQQDTAAAYLSDEIERLDNDFQKQQYVPADSQWLFLAELLQLDTSAQFVLALALSYRLDSAIGQLCASCMNDLSRPYPSLTLAQRLWHDPLPIIECAHPSHALYRYGVLQYSETGEFNHGWQSLLSCHSMLASMLIDAAGKIPAGMKRLELAQGYNTEAGLIDEISLARIRAASHQHMQLIPLLGSAGSDFSGKAQGIAHQLNHRLLTVDMALLKDSGNVRAVALLCWMQGYDVLLPDLLADHPEYLNSLQSMFLEHPVPINWYLPQYDKKQLNQFPAALQLPEINLPPLNFEQRLACFRHYLHALTGIDDLIIKLCAQRFRFQQRMIRSVAQALLCSERADGRTLLQACAHEATTEFNELAQYVQPRFTIEQLVLPAEQKQQYLDIVHAMRSLTLVHHHWGTAKAWNESGLSVLFCGPPGTGKTMAAEALSHKLELPMYRIDLSQVVNKYIGETEKNLRRIFHAAEMTDCILFFDEADAIFGKRTDVKDAHDRFANIEISYLLERMERFKGLAILATNRRRDLDDAFMRRLRHVIEFPVPEKRERNLIWKQVFPAQVDTSELDFNYLARQFKLSGGHIHSIAFNTCLRSADINHPDAEQKVDMRNTLIAVKQELSKMERAPSDELFGDYAELLKGVEE